MSTNIRSIEAEWQLCSETGSPNFLVQWPHNILHNSLRSGHCTQRNSFGICYILSNQQMFRTMLFFINDKMFSRAGWNGSLGRIGRAGGSWEILTLEEGLQNLRTYKTWILSSSWATGWRMQLITQRQSPLKRLKNFCFFQRYEMRLR